MSQFISASPNLLFTEYLRWPAPLSSHCSTENTRQGTDSELPASVPVVMNSAEQFEAIVADHYESLFRFALSLTRSESDARDLTQHTFHVWAKKGDQLRDISRTKTWLFTTMHRAFLKIQGKRVRYPHYPLEETELPAVAHESATHLDSSEAVIALSHIDEIYRAAVVLFYLRECSYAEIGDILNIPLGTVKSRIARGISQLREILLSDAKLCEHATV